MYFQDFQDWVKRLDDSKSVINDPKMGDARALIIEWLNLHSGGVGEDSYDGRFYMLRQDRRDLEDEDEDE